MHADDTEQVEDVRFERRGHLGRITLDRPSALNALTPRMVNAIATMMRTWAADAEVEVVYIDSSGDRGLSAGGDIRVVYQSIQDKSNVAKEFWRDEYLLNALIASFPKPVVAVMDGIVMGGGIGISSHASFRVVTERSLVAMPEVRLGLCPDVGSTYLFTRAPGESGMHLALTGSRIGAKDAISCGLADYFLPSSSINQFRRNLESTSAEQAVRQSAVHVSLREGEFIGSQGWIDYCYTADSLEAVIHRLRAYNTPESRRAAGEIVSASPLACQVTFEALRRARRLDNIEKCLAQEYRVSCRFLDTADLPEGIRAAVIDKDHNPQWHPKDLGDVSSAMVTRHFESLGKCELFAHEAASHC